MSECVKEQALKLRECWVDEEREGRAERREFVGVSERDGSMERES